MTRISEAVILMAGSGSRLRGPKVSFLKPLTPVNGRPLIAYTFAALLQAGIERIVAVTGFESERLETAVSELAPPQIELSFAHNPQWQKQNGISLLAVASHVTAPFLLTMSDHLFDPAIVDLLVAAADFDELNLAIDRKIDSIFDLDDAMKVQTRAGRVVGIGKDLAKYDAVDTGLFICPQEIFDYLEPAMHDGDCSLADGVRLMASEGKVRVIDIGAMWWQDVDTPEMLAYAEDHLRTRP